MLGIIEESKGEGDELDKSGSSQVSKIGKTLHPTDPEIKSVEGVAAGSTQPRVDVSSIYPEGTKGIESEPYVNPNANFAMKLNEEVYKDNDRPVSMRVKSLLVLGILSVVSLLLYFLVYITSAASSQYGGVTMGAMLAQLGIDAYLLFSKSVSGVRLLLKIFLVLQLINLTLSLVNPIAFLFNGIMAAFLFYVYGSVKALR